MTEYDTQAPIEERRAAKFIMGAEKEAANRTVKRSPEVLIPGHFIDLDDLPKSPRTIRDIAALQPNTRARHSRTFEEGAVFATGKKAGEKRPDKTMDHYALGHYGAAPWTAAWSDGKLLLAKGYRNGVYYEFDGVKQLVAWIKEEERDG